MSKKLLKKWRVQTLLYACAVVAHIYTRFNWFLINFHQTGVKFDFFETNRNDVKLLKLMKKLNLRPPIDFEVQEMNFSVKNTPRKRALWIIFKFFNFCGEKNLDIARIFLQNLSKKCWFCVINEQKIVVKVVIFSKNYSKCRTKFLYRVAML